MFLPWIFKKKIFGVVVDIEFDFWGSIFKTWQTIYQPRMKVWPVFLPNLCQPRPPVNINIIKCLMNSGYGWY